MPLFHANTGNLEQQIPTLLERMVKLRMAVALGTIDPQLIERIATLSTVELDEILKCTEDEDSELEFLYRIISSANEILIIPSSELNDCLQWFDTTYNHYLDLCPLAVENPRDLRCYLNHFAIFYDLFIQFIELDEADNTFNANINISLVQERCASWEKTRSSQAAYNPRHHVPASVLKKFLADRLSPMEWLTDIDLLDAFQLLDLTRFGAHITTFDVRDIREKICLELENHANDQLKEPYAIPLIISDSDRLDTEGTHWTRMLIIVDPRKMPLGIQAFYTDSLSLINKSFIEATIRDAFTNQRERSVTERSQTLENALSACRLRIVVQGAEEQEDSYSCGYRALHGLLHDLNKHGFLPRPTVRQQALLSCKTSDQLRNFIYTILLAEQPITFEQGVAYLLEERNQKYYVKPEYVKKQLCTFLPQPQEADSSSASSDSPTQSLDSIESDVSNTKNYSKFATTQFNSFSRHKPLKNLSHFKSWWLGHTNGNLDSVKIKTMKEQTIRWLNKYKNKWWPWVSRDRRAVATALIAQLTDLDSLDLKPTQILRIIANAREKILQNDDLYKRNVSAGLQGRLYSFLGNLETQVLAVSTPTERDLAIQSVFDEIKTVLTVFNKHKLYRNSLPKVIKALQFNELTPITHETRQIITAQYQVISEFFTRVLINLQFEELKDPNLKALYTFCDQKQKQLMNYFDQCDQLSFINRQKSVQVFRAMNAAASTVVDQWLHTPSKKNMNPVDVIYGNKKIPLINGLIRDTINKDDFPKSFFLHSFSFFNKKTTLHTAKIHKICTDLLRKLEEEIRLYDKEVVHIEFTSLELTPNPTQSQFLGLTVNLTIDGVETAVTYTLQSKTGELVQIQSELAELDHLSSCAIEFN